MSNPLVNVEFTADSVCAFRCERNQMSVLVCMTASEWMALIPVIQAEVRATKARVQSNQTGEEQ